MTIGSALTGKGGMTMIDREKVIKGLQECDLNGGRVGNCPYKDALLDLLKEQEKYISRISVEYLKLVKKVSKTSKIVRCKNCIYKECEGRDGLIVCDITGESHEPEWFCAYGGRR